jgi:hypothetical protein
MSARLADPKTRLTQYANFDLGTRFCDHRESVFDTKERTGHAASSAQCVRLVVALAEAGCSLRYS